MNREGKKSNPNPDVKHIAAENDKIEETHVKDSDYITEIASNIFDTLHTLMSTGSMLETCSEALACKAKQFLPTLPPTALLPGVGRCEQLQRQNSSCISSK